MNENNEQKPNPNYYAIVPSEVRYDDRFKEGPKLMYGEITALSNTFGYCKASNNYFARLYKRSPQCISKWIKTLEKCGHIFLKYISYETGRRERRIYLSDPDKGVSTGVEGYQHTLIPYQQVLRGYQHRIKYNNTSINNIVVVEGEKQKLTDYEIKVTGWVKQLQADFYFFEQCERKFKFGRSKVEELMKSFLEEKRALGANHASYKDWKSNFYFWMNIQKKKIESNLDRSNKGGKQETFDSEEMHTKGVYDGPIIQNYQ